MVRLAFATWVCPEWTVEQIVEAANRYGYEGVEIRLDVGHAHKVGVDMSEEGKLIVRRTFKGAGVHLCCLSSSARFSSPDPKERNKFVSQVKAEIELAADLGCPCLRVFGGLIPEGVNRSDAEAYIADCLKELAEFADAYGVFVCMETHDAFSRAADAVRVVQRVNHPRLGIVWDIRHPFTNGEPLPETFTYLKPFVRHCHIGDLKREGGKWVFAPLGEGEVPLKEALHYLRDSGYDGFLSLEVINVPIAPEMLLEDTAKKVRAWSSL